MSRARKKTRAFVIENRRLGLDRLVQETGLSPRQVRRLLAEPGAEEGPAHPRSRQDGPRWTGAVAGLVAIVTALVYMPALSNAFVNWDDPSVLVENLHIRRLDGASLGWMFTTFHTGNWIPLTWLSHALVYRLAGLDPSAHHLVNVLLHALNTALVLLVSLELLRLGRIRAAPPSAEAPQRDLVAATIAALLFGLHPLHVESVAWVAERKDLLCALFFLLSLRAYLAYIGSTGPPSRPARGRRDRLALSLGLFVLALLSKPMAVTLPVVLLILDRWPLRRLGGDWRRALLEKLPFFVAAIGAGLLTITAQASAGAIAAAERVGTAFRLMNAALSLVRYLWQMVVPAGLLPFYPIVDAERAFTPATTGSAVLVLALTAACVIHGAERRAWLGAAWAYYVVTLLPVLGVLQVGGQSHADRYTYLPSVAPFLLAGAGIAAWRGAALLGLALAAGLSILTVRQIGTWRDSITLWERVIQTYPDVSPIVHNNLANAHRSAGRLDDAVREYRRALAIRRHAYSLDGLGITLLDQGRVDEAISELENAIADEPRYAKAHRNLWFAYRRKGREDLALSAIERAVAADPDYADAWSNLGISQGVHGRLPESEQAFLRALQLDPGNPDFLANLATTYQQQGRLEKAVTLYERACRLDPSEPLHFSNLGKVYLAQGRFSDALTSFRRAQEAGGRVDPALLNRAEAGARALP